MTIRTPLTSPVTPTLRPVDPAEYAAHEAANRRAAVQYEQIPISLGLEGQRRPCAGCGGKTWSMSGLCNKCTNWRVL